MWASTISRQELQQSISRLEMLSSVPQPPEENVMPTDVHSSHHLSIVRERQIVSNLAFISATSDDGNRVMAVCIEEHRNGVGTTIRIASNSNNILEVTNGFILLARILERAAKREIPKLESIQDLFRQVVILDFHRILSRLRSRHAKRSIRTAGKPALVIQLNDVFFDESIMARPGLVLTDIQHLRDKAQRLKVLYSSLEHLSTSSDNTSKMQEILGEIVQQAHELTATTDLSNVLQRLLGNPNLKTHLLNAIGKLGRYYSVSDELVCAARDRKHQIFQSIQVEAFNIQKPVSLNEMDGKVHAEIKLLFFYELHPDYPRPRFICSSKSACYMCNLFFHLHGGFNVPRTHGKLYPKWILPDWLDIPINRQRELSIVLTRLKESLDKDIQKAKKLKKRYPDPNESVLSEHVNWSSSSVRSRSQPSSGPGTSTSTIRPRSALIQKEKQSGKVILSTETQLTPPRTPPDLVPSEIISPNDTNQSITPRALSLASICRRDIPTREPSVITIQRSELAYSKYIKGIAPLLHLQLDKLSLTFEFVRGFSGHLSITLAEDTIDAAKECQTVAIEDIPTTTELRVDCSHTSNELVVQLQKDHVGIVCFKFLWDDAITDAEILSSDAHISKKKT
ncbi:hypothetical protein B7463_g2601, partial [Scytalidium lignicola]